MIDKRIQLTGNLQFSMQHSGSSVPKPLTYDYMPEGYPSKSVQTTVLMEEQECVFTENRGTYTAVLTDGLILVAGQTYTVNWDGTEYECVCSELGQYLFIGNLSISAGGEDTGEPFIYTPANKVFAARDTAPNHTISVKTIQEVITPMTEEFMPVLTAPNGTKYKITVDDDGTPSFTNIENSSEIWKPTNVTDDHINSLIDTKLGVIENGAY